ncbi:hypothetical protein C0992_002549, partial [Termitomyces sp. T32_za158]
EYFSLDPALIQPVALSINNISDSSHPGPSNSADTLIDTSLAFASSPPTIIRSLALIAPPSNIYNVQPDALVTITTRSTSPDSIIPTTQSHDPDSSIVSEADLFAQDEWVSNIQALFLKPLDYDKLLSIAHPGPTAAHVSPLIYTHIHALLSNTPLPTDLAPGIRFKNFTMNGLFASRLRISIGEGVGDGPVRSAWAGLLLHMVATGHWAEIAPGLFTPHFIPGIIPSAADITAYKTYGLILRLTLLHNQVILPISPFLILLLSHNFEIATNMDLINKVAPLLAIRLATWPPQKLFNSETGEFEMDLTNGQDPMLLVVDLIPNVTIQYVRTLGEESLKVIKKQLTAGLLFATTNYLGIQTHPLFLALKSGFNDDFAETGSTTSFIETFGESEHALRLINALYIGKTVTNIEQVIALIRTQPIDTIGTTLDEDECRKFEKLALKSIKRFLRGHGLPTGEGSENRHDNNANHPLFRCKEFLRSLTGSEYLPDQHILIRFVNLFSPSQRLASNVGAHIHVCTKHMDFLLNDDTKSLLTPPDANAPTHISTHFDQWFWSIIDTSHDEYNNA